MNPHLYLDEVDRLQEAWFGCQHAGIDHTTCGRNDLTTSSMDGICMECDIVDVESNSTDILFTQNTLDKRGGGD